jgi:hypothetical protein
MKKISLFLCILIAIETISFVMVSNNPYANGLVMSFGTALCFLLGGYYFDQPNK